MKRKLTISKVCVGRHNRESRDMGIEDEMLRHAKAAHAMQSGVAYEMNDPERRSATDPKHLRVGINAAMSDQGGLVTLLIEKGLFTREEYVKAIADAMEHEAAAYQARISQKLGKDVKLV